MQFSAASYAIDESPGAMQTITVTRTGGSRGAVTATFTTSDGTAVAGADYTPVNATVFFADGDADAARWSTCRSSSTRSTSRTRR